MGNNAIIVFVKNEQLGKVKTRLAAEVGEEEALRIYGLLLDHTAQVINCAACDTFVYYDTFIPVHDERWIPNAKLTQAIQEGEDLGNRMRAAFQEVLATHENVLIVGSDCPGLQDFDLQKAFDLLNMNDVIFGPAMDGGYYMLGLKQWHDAVIQDIEWSTSHVLQQTIKGVEKLNWSYKLLRPLSDIDYLADWKEHKHLLDS